MNKMSNTISRQEAIDALENIFNRCEEIKWHLQDGDTDKDDYKMYPDYLTVWKYLNQDEDHGADTVPVRHGKWIIYVISPFDGEDVKCSECGQHGCAPYWDYCPYCGSKNDEIINENDI